MPDTDLTTRRCRPCDSGTPTLPPEEVESLLSRIEGWSLADGHLERSFRFGNYHETIAFVNAGGAQGGTPSRPGSGVQVLQSEVLDSRYRRPVGE